MIIFNWLGIALAALWFLILGVTMTFTQNREHILAAVVTASLLVILGDSFLRKSGPGKRWIHPKAGGHLFFIPMWVVALGIAGFMILLYLR